LLAVLCAVEHPLLQPLQPVLTVSVLRGSLFRCCGRQAEKSRQASSHPLCTRFAYQRIWPR
jgi:hypothetical protein